MIEKILRAAEQARLDHFADAGVMVLVVPLWADLEMCQESADRQFGAGKFIVIHPDPL